MKNTGQTKAVILFFHVKYAVNREKQKRVQQSGGGIKNEEQNQ